MDRTAKEASVGSLHEAIMATTCLIVTHQTGLNAGEVTALRQQVRTAGADFKVTKNRSRVSPSQARSSSIWRRCYGPTAIAYSADPVAAAKVVVEFAGKNDKLKIIGGGLGATQLDVSGVKSLATMPSLDELRARLIGVLLAPASKIAAVLQAPGGQLARVLNAYATKDEAA